MKKIFILLLLITSKSFAQSFEGSIKFKTEIFIKGVIKKNIDYIYGDSLIASYSKNGYLKREYLNSGSSGNYIQIYNPNNGMLYLRSRKSKIDSIDVKINSIVLTRKKKINNETIMNLDCECFEYTGESNQNKNVILNYCYSLLSPKLDYKLFEKHNDFFLNDYFQTSERPYLKFSLKTDEFKISFTASELLEKHINENTLDIRK